MAVRLPHVHYIQIDNMLAPDWESVVRHSLLADTIRHEEFESRYVQVDWPVFPARVPEELNVHPRTKPVQLHRVPRNSLNPVLLLPQTSPALGPWDFLTPRE